MAGPAALFGGAALLLGPIWLGAVTAPARLPWWWVYLPATTRWAVVP